ARWRVGYPNLVRQQRRRFTSSGRAATGVLGLMRIVTSLPHPFVVPDLPDQGTAGSVPWGGHRFPNGKTMSTPRLVVGEKTAVFVIAGQSNCSNSVDTAYSPGNAAKVDNFNI